VWQVYTNQKGLKVKKLFIISTATLSIIALSYFTINNNKAAKSNQPSAKYADARLTMGKIEKNIEIKINYILENVTKNGATPTSRELKSLISSIEVLRAYGKDINKEAKIKLLKIAKKLVEENFQDIKTLKKLKDISITSQQLTA
jgi:hypothetical protein